LNSAQDASSDEVSMARMMGMPYFNPPHLSAKSAEAL